MKKLIAAILTLILILSVSANVLADGTTTLTTTVPSATYTLNIPADQEIAFGACESDIGNVTVTDSAGFAKGKDLKVTITYDAFSSDSVNTTIPYKINPRSSENLNLNTNILYSGDHLIFRGISNGAVAKKAELEKYSVDYLNIKIASEDWGKALAGEYSSTITFTSEVVSSEN